MTYTRNRYVSIPGIAAVGGMELWSRRHETFAYHDRTLVIDSKLVG
jgi:hypothetical protein